MPIAEDHPQTPVNPYGEYQAARSSSMLHWYGAGVRPAVVALRYFNAAGANRDGRCASTTNRRPPHPARDRRRARHAARRTIYGDDYPTPDGTCIRDYIHVEISPRAPRRAGQAPRPATTIGPINLGTGRGYSVRAVIAAVGRVTGKSVRTREVGRRAGRSAGAGRGRAPGRRAHWGGNRATRSSRPSSSTRSAGARTASVRDADLGRALAPAAAGVGV